VPVVADEEGAVKAEGDEEGVRVALLCIQEKRRPDMLEVTRMLSSTKKAMPFPRRPGYATESPMYAGDRSTTL
jgi:hypothetical protein